MNQSVADHYTIGDIEGKVLAALQKAGVDIDNLTVDDLSSMDAFHIRGREATEELVEVAGIDGEARVIDVGCGIGGTSRFLADRFGCSVSGIDLTAAYCEAATALTSRVGLSHRTVFQQGSALDLPFPEDHFDFAWTEHVQMNIEDKTRLYAEIFRVLKPGGRLAFHDIFAGPGEGFAFPVPWASEAEQSFLWPLDRLTDTLRATGFQTLHFQDNTEESVRFFEERLSNPPAPGAPSIGLLMGEGAPTKMKNVLENLRADRLRVVQAVLEK